MNDPTAVIRAALARAGGIDTRHDPDRATRALTALRDAVAGVLDIHVPRDPTDIETVGLASWEKGKQVCAMCEPGAGQMGQREVYPCTTVRAITGPLGIRVLEHG